MGHGEGGEVSPHIPEGGGGEVLATVQYIHGTRGEGGGGMTAHT